MVAIVTTFFGIIIMVAGIIIYDPLYTLQGATDALAFFYAALPFLAGLIIFIFGLKGHEVN